MSNLNDWAIGEHLFNHIINNYKYVNTIVELGSGTGTIELTKHFNVFSVEHNEKWLGKAINSNYIYAPIENGWYDVDVLKEMLPQKYELLLIDGPPAKIGRFGVVDNIDLFKSNIIFIVDDTHRDADLEVLVSLAKKLNRPYKIYEDNNKSFGVIE